MNTKKLIEILIESGISVGDEVFTMKGIHTVSVIEIKETVVVFEISESIAFSSYSPIGATYGKRFFKDEFISEMDAEIRNMNQKHNKDYNSLRGDKTAQEALIMDLYKNYMHLLYSYAKKSGTYEEFLKAHVNQNKKFKKED